MTQTAANTADTSDMMADLFAEAPSAPPAHAPAVASSAPTNAGALLVVEPVALPAIAQTELIPTSSLPPELMAQAETEAAKITFDDPVRLSTYGRPIQDALNKLLDELIEGITTENAGVIGDIMTELKTGISEMELDKIHKELEEMGVTHDGEGWSVRGFMRHLPGIGHAFSHVENFMEKKAEIGGKFNAVRDKAEGRMVAIIEYMSKIDALIKNSVKRSRQLAVAIVIGQMALARAHAEFERRRALITAASDPNEAGELRALRSAMTQFSVRLLVMKRSLVHTATVGRLQKEMTLEAAQIELQNIQNILDFTLTNMKELVVVAAAEISIKRAQIDGEAINDAEAKMLKASLAMLNQVFIAAKESQGRELSAVELLKYASDELLKTAAQGEAIDAANEEKRAKAETMLIGIKEKVTAAAA